MKCSAVQREWALMAVRTCREPLYLFYFITRSYTEYEKKNENKQDKTALTSKRQIQVKQTVSPLTTSQQCCFTTALILTQSARKTLTLNLYIYYKKIVHEVQR